MLNYLAFSVDQGACLLFIDIQGPDWIPEPFTVPNTEDLAQQTGSNPPPPGILPLSWNMRKITLDL